MNELSLEEMISMLEDKDTSKAFEVLKELEQISEDSDILYPYIDQFIEMASSDKYVIRVRGFRLLCKQGKWDTDNKIDECIDDVLVILNDPKPTAVRQALAALQDLVPYKEDLKKLIKDKVMAINYLQYKDTMHSLIAKDIQNLLERIDESK